MAQKFDPRVKLIAHHANIKDAQYTVQWFSEFDLVFNALDNLDARRHVNRMCLAADVPLIESGTTGFNGNVQVIKKGKTACYDCRPKELPKSFPVCTVRSTPSQPIHTIVWAKSYLLPELFGVSEDQVEDFDQTTNSENAEEIKKLKAETEQLRKIKESMGSDDFAEKVFDQVYRKDIERLLSMEDYWKEKKAPQPLSFELFSNGSESVQPSIANVDQRVWTITETFVVFKDSLRRLATRLADQRAEALKNESPEPVIEFDKDDDDTLDFVTAAANLWSAAFAIEPKSKFDTKQMAGNIIPAIATTNAMVASLCVLQAYKVLREELPKTRELFLQKSSMGGDISDLPNPSCQVCSRAMLRIQINLETATVKDLFDSVKSEIGYDPEVTISIDSPQVVLYDYMEAEDDEEAAAKRLEMKLSEFGVKVGTSLLVTDDSDKPRVDVQLFVESTDEVAVRLVTKEKETLEIPRKVKAPVAEEAPKSNGTETAQTGIKRKRNVDDDGEGDARSAKKKQTDENAGAEGAAIVIDDDEDGAAILLD